MKNCLKLAALVVALALLGSMWLHGRPAQAAIGDLFAVYSNSAKADVFRVTSNGTVVTTSGVVMHRTTTSTNGYQMAVTDNLVGVTGTDTAAKNIYLPDAAGCPVGQVFAVKDESGAAATNNIKVYGLGTDTVDGAATHTISSNYGAVRVYKSATGKWMTY